MDFWPLLVATLGGAAIGAERQWSGHASGPEARFAGLRTFTMLGGLAGLCGHLWNAGVTWPSAAIMAAAGALVVGGYIAASRHDVDGTTETAALVVLAAGMAAGLGATRLASGAIAVTALLLVEKTRLHGLVDQLDDTGMRAAIRFGVMAIVVLPLLPEGPFGPLGGVRPRQLWMLVLFFSGLSFAGYIARRLAGPAHGYPIAGMLGGLLSSTSVTLTYARLSGTGVPARPLAFGAVGACTVLFARVLLAVAVLHTPLAFVLAPYFVLPFLIGVCVVAFGLRGSAADAVVVDEVQNPLQVRAALEMALLFQGVLFGVTAAQQAFGDPGLLVSGVLVGLTDIDALTLSMARSASAGTPVHAAATGVVLGVLSNTFLKGAIAVSIGQAQFRTITGAALAAQATALVAALVLAT